MASFSERVGRAEPRAIQTDGMDDALASSLWNLFFDAYSLRPAELFGMATRLIAAEFRRSRLDEHPGTVPRSIDWFKDYFFSLDWMGRYDLVEFLVQHHSQISDPIQKSLIIQLRTQQQLVDTLNRIFERELSGYRMIEGVLVPISDPVEVAEVSEAVDAGRRVGFEGVHVHIRSALELLGKKPVPDYRNSIKESISAVEAAVKTISGEPKATLDHALKELARCGNIHSALQAGFRKLYGYTSDGDGIRHAITDVPTVGFTEAKYMLVSCSAFVNYLIAKADDGGLLEENEK